MPVAIGVDIGSVSTSAGVYMNGRIQIIPFETGNTSIPSYVAFTETQFLTGEAAKHQGISNPKNTIFGVKRFIGRSFDDPITQKSKELFPYEIENYEGKIKISVTQKGEKKVFDPEEIAAMILRKVKQAAEVQVGNLITSAVLTVPTSFNDSQRQAMKDAGAIAGLDILDILNEPTAVALAYVLDKTSIDEKNVLVCDLGCGTFYASVLKVKKHEKLEIQATAGDTYFGGVDFDFKLFNYAASYIYEKLGKDIREDAEALRRLEIACEDATKILATKEETAITVDGIDLKIKLSGSKFEELCQPIFDRIIELLEKVLLESNKGKKDIDEIIFVGKSSKIPKLRSIVSDYSGGKIIHTSVNLDEAVTHGAAIQAAMLSGYKDKRINELLFMDDVTSLSIGIETSGGAMAVVIERNSSIPTQASCKTTTSYENQASVAIKVFEGERALTSDNHLLDSMVLSGIPPLSPGIPEIEVTFEINCNGILTVSAKGNTYVEPNKMSISLNKNRRTSEELDRRLLEAQSFQKQDDEMRETVRYKVTLESYISAIKSAATKAKEKISDRDKLEIHKICNETQLWLDTNLDADKEDLIEKRKEVFPLLQPFAVLLGVSAKQNIARSGSIPVPCHVSCKKDE